MNPREEKNKSNPEKCAELKEGWADHLPLKYDDKIYDDCFGIQFLWRLFLPRFLRIPLI